MRIWRLTLLPLLLAACTDQPIAAPEFNANGVVDDDMSQYTLLGEFPADLPIYVDNGDGTIDTLGFALPCLGEGLFGYEGGLYQWWRKTIRMPAGGRVAVEKILQPEYGSYYNELNDRWRTTRIQARISRITRPGDGHTLIREAFNEWVENEDTGQQARITLVLQKERDELGDDVTNIEKLAHCSLTGNKK